MPQVMAVDYGTVRVGLAVSDPEGRYALPLETLTLPRRARAAAVAERAAEREASIIVVGRPVRAAGEDSALWPEIRAFGDALARRGFEVVYEDEAFSSTAAEALEPPPGGRRRKVRTPADALAAKLILEQYLQHANQ